MSPTDNTIETKIRTDYNWIVNHLILLAVTGLLVFLGIYGIENLIEKHDAVVANRDSQILSAQVQQTQAIEKQLTSDEAHWTQIEQALLAQNAQLAKTIASEKLQLAKQVQENATLTAQQAAERLIEQTKATIGEIAASGDNVVVDLPIARKLVDTGDTLVATKIELANTQTQLTNETTIADNAKADAAGKDTVISNLKATNAAQIKSCDAQISLVKAHARKGKLKAFALGFVTGITLGIWKF